MATIEQRTSRNGEVAYRAKIRLRGHRPVSETFPRRTDAVRWVQKTETEIREGLYFPKQEAKKHTVAEAIDCYLDHLKFDNPGRHRDVGIILKWWRNELGDYLLSDISKGLIMQKRTLLTKENIKRGEKVGVRSPSTINRYMSAMSTTFKYISKQYDWMLDNPMRDIKNFREPEGIVRYLSDEERLRLLQACKRSENPYLYTIVVLGISSGARKSEINCIKWSDVNLDRKTIVLPKTKNRQIRTIHLSGEALSEIQRLYQSRRESEMYVFPSPTLKDKPRDSTRSWRTALDRADVKNFRFHDLRHTSASYFAMSGANIKDIAEILGHKSLAMTYRYAHLANTHVADVVERMNGKVFGS